MKLKIAAVGCAHGQLKLIYDTIAHHGGADLVLLCGDVQTARNETDLASMSVPDKYKSMGDFHLYYEGKEQIPYPTICIGGNHEASHYLMEYPQGGFLCPQLYYLGRSGIVQFAGLCIGGVSGIYKEQDFHAPRHEAVPLTETNKRSVYHVRKQEYDLLGVYPHPIDIMLSHDWPAGIEHCGDLNALLKKKPFLRSDIEQGLLGSPPSMAFLKSNKPCYWFAAHMHVKFSALVSHEGSDTKFLALDKPLPQRSFWHMLTIESRNDRKEILADPEWQAILQKS